MAVLADHGSVLIKHVAAVSQVCLAVPGGDLLQAAGRPAVQPVEEAVEFVETTATTRHVERVAEGTGQRGDRLVAWCEHRQDQFLGHQSPT
ncbi:hypothetical protein ACIOMQ_40920 [Streptomyces sp. NPDC087845]|uniref:hypothetical protein n=1 Tax=Streptomyces sp. NPDC087845 TaxID=3365806 RepID=UPI0038272C83